MIRQEDLDRLNFLRNWAFYRWRDTKEPLPPRSGKEREELEAILKQNIKRSLPLIGSSTPG
jgi:hypothetical protein